MSRSVGAAVSIDEFAVGQFPKDVVIRSREVPFDSKSIVARFVGGTTKIEVGKSQLIEALPFTIELFDGERLDYVGTEADLSGPQGLVSKSGDPVVSWYGQRLDEKGAVMGAAVFTIVPEAAGYVWTGDVFDAGRRFHLSPLDVGRSVLFELDPSKMPPLIDGVTEGTAQPVYIPPGPPPKEVRPGLKAAAGVGPIIDVFAAHTPIVQPEVPGVATTIRWDIMNNLNLMNLAFINSAMGERVRLVGVEEIPDRRNGGNLGDILFNIQDPINNGWNAVPARRNALSADVAITVVESAPDDSGQGFVPAAPPANDPTRGYSVVSEGFVRGDFGLPHELGHNVGGNHDPANASAGAPPFSYARGHRVPGVARTVMAYDCNVPTVSPAAAACPTLPQYSNPAVRFIGYPSEDSGVTGTEYNSASMSSLASTVASYRSPAAGQGAGSINNDARKDLVAVSGNNLWAMTSTGGSFSSPALWQVAPTGSVATLFGDVTGDKRTDTIAVNGSDTVVAVSNGSTFVGLQQWSNVAFYGGLATFAAEVTGDDAADLVAVSSNAVWVMPSTGAGFSTPVNWSTALFYGTVATLVGDVTGDGRADLVAVNPTSVWVMVSTGTGFGLPVWWGGGAFYGSVVTLAGDLTGDGRADLLAVNGSSTWAKISTGYSFGSSTLWSLTSVIGSKATLLADVSGDSRADLVAVNDTTTKVMTSNGSSLNGSSQWSLGAFYGTLATVAA
jgi:FG-GAP-like repeat/Metallo-peptidase family M12B Reprolysin-like